MAVKVKGGAWCPRCKQPVQAERNGHGVRNSVGALATLGLSIKTEAWTCPNCGAECSTSAPSTGSGTSKRQAKILAGGAKVEWRCKKNGHLMDRRCAVCPIDGSPNIWRTKL